MRETAVSEIEKLREQVDDPEIEENLGTVEAMILDPLNDLERNIDGMLRDAGEVVARVKDTAITAAVMTAFFLVPLLLVEAVIASHGGSIPSAEWNAVIFGSSGVFLSVFPPLGKALVETRKALT